MIGSRKPKSQFLNDLNLQQKKAVTFGNGPLLIIAGAGTGKTTVLTRRIVWLIEQKLAKPEEILALTFTDKAANEMRDRVDLLMPLGYADIHISTFHSFAQKILLQHALDIGLPGDFQVITPTQAWILVKKHLYDFDLDYYRPAGNPNKFIHSMLKHFERAKREGISPEEYLKFAENQRLNSDRAEKIMNHESGIMNQEISRINELANAYHKYQKLLLDANFLDFSDLITYCLKLFKTRPKILKFYQTQFKFVLVDEFQDTDLAQYELIKLLAKPGDNITMVGDDDQSIFKFRGASISNILKFKEDYPKASEITLVENYRSSQNILDLSYEFIQQNNPYRLEAKLKIAKKLRANLTTPGTIEVLHTATGHEEARAVADKIVALNQTDGLSFNEFAILVRANDSAEVFLAELSRRGIPYIYVASKGLYRKPIVVELLSYLQILDNFHRNELLFRILTLPKFKIDHQDLILITHLAYKKSSSVYEALKNLETSEIRADISEESKKQIKVLLEMLDRHARLAKELPVSELFVKIVNDTGLDKKLMEETVENIENRNLVNELYRKAQDFESENTDKELKGFLTELDLEAEAGEEGSLPADLEAGPEAVKVMTIHSAKGLEFACVFVVNLADQRFPSRDRKEQIPLDDALVKEILPEGDAHLMEERRLFYVSLTRAKKYLYLTWSDYYSGNTKKKPSQFLVESGFEKKPEKTKPTGEVFFRRQQQTLPIAKVDYSAFIPETFDFSQISCFKKCPLEYKFRYIYKIPTKGSGAMSFGSTMHNTLKKFMQNVTQLNSGQKVDLFGKVQTGLVIPKKDELLKFYHESWIDDWYDNKNSKEKYRQDGLKFLGEFYDSFVKAPKLAKYLEQSFKLKLGDYKFKGRIDRADINPEGALDIIDYKTGELRTKLEQVDKDQLLIYQWAAQEALKEKVNSLSYYYFKSIETPLKFLGTAEDIEKLKEKLLETIKEIVTATKHNDFHNLDLEKSHDCKYRELEG
jgi:DNA helicase-2/ATP-dependent DNA helicase PcrA